MTVEDIIPNADTSPNEWLAGTPQHHDSVDEHPSPPTTGGDSIGAAQSTGNEGDREEFGYTTIIGDFEVTQLKLFAYCHYINGGNIDGYVVIGGDTLGYASFVPTATYSWKSITWTGLSYTKAELDGIISMVTANGITTKGFVVEIATMYIEVTFTAISLGYPHKVMGVEVVNIGKVLGVETTDIGKVLGV